MKIGIAAALFFTTVSSFNCFKGSIPESPYIKTIITEQDFRMVLDSAGSRLIIVDLYADWCGPCRMLHPTLDALAQKYTGKVAFYRVNVDANPKIAAAFGANGIPFVVFIKEGKTVASLVGLNPSDSYEKVISTYGPI
ncbi:MAG: thioredoxin [Chitinivibrionales bacterium]|nr:thioredoxin [Chitinivibrionales bacterium]